MKKVISLVIGGFVIGALISPVVGMAIGSTRSLILGMAPDEAILTLADKIDEQKVVVEQVQAENEQKTGELQSAVADQQAQLAEQQKMIDEQIKASAESKKLIECQALQKKASWCIQDEYRLSLDSFLEKRKKENPPAMKNDDVVDGAKKDWKMCQTFYQEYTASGCN